jgi:hypothetical protein
MDEYYFSVNLDGSRELCLAPLTDRQIELSGQDISDRSGHFLFERCLQSARIEIIAHVLSPDAVLRLCNKFNMA